MPESRSDQHAESARGISEEQRTRCIEIHESMIRKNEARIREHWRQIEVIERANTLRRDALALLLSDGSTDG